MSTNKQLFDELMKVQNALVVWNNGIIDYGKTALMVLFYLSNYEQGITLANALELATEFNKNI